MAFGEGSAMVGQWGRVGRTRCIGMVQAAYGTTEENSRGTVEKTPWRTYYD